MLKKLKRRYSRTTIRKKIIFLMFSLIIFAPTLLIAILMSAYYYYGIEPLFNNKIKNSLDHTVKVATAYVAEHKENIKYDILAMANEIQTDQNFFLLIRRPDVLQKLLNNQVAQRALSEAIIFSRNKVIAKSSASYFISYPNISKQHLDIADNHTIYILDSQDSMGGDDNVRAIVKLNKFFDDTYLIVGRKIDSSIINYLDSSKGSADYYNNMLHDINLRKLKLTLLFLASVLLLMILTLYYGLRFANIISRPINILAKATDKIRKGDYSIRVSEDDSKDETNQLAKAFNLMTATIEQQRDELLEANSLMQERAQFIETVLSEISSGVITLDHQYKISYINVYAKKLFDITNRKLVGKSYNKFLPELESLLTKSRELLRPVADNITTNVFGKNLSLMVTVGAIAMPKPTNSISHLSDEADINNKKTSITPTSNLIDSDNAGYLESDINQYNITSYIITLDDITDHVTAERLRAWSDVAKRIAHEIKNPLTPISLSAERLEAKFGRTLEPDASQMFTRYVNTIMSHVDDIRRIIENFVEFAKLPDPKLEILDIKQLVDDKIFSLSSVYRRTSFELECAESHTKVLADKNLISQVLINLLKNSAESIESHSKLLEEQSPNELQDYQGKIKVVIKPGSRTRAHTKSHSSSELDILIYDNGSGFPANKLDIITEPYVTTKAKGTGLGLAIVRKIIEDHNNTLWIKNLKPHGAMVGFNLKLADKSKT